MGPPLEGIKAEAMLLIARTQKPRRNIILQESSPLTLFVSKHVSSTKVTSFKNIDGVTAKIIFDEKGDLLHGALTLYTYKGKDRVQIAVVR